MRHAQMYDKRQYSLSEPIKKKKTCPWTGFFL
jgi:hypothetical protein